MRERGEEGGQKDKRKEEGRDELGRSKGIKGDSSVRETAGGAF